MPSCDLLSRRAWGAGDHSLAQGLKGDATYLVVNDKGSLENYGINGAQPRPLALWPSGELGKPQRLLEGGITCGGCGSG